MAHRQYLAEALADSAPEKLELCLSSVRIPWQILRVPSIDQIGALRLAVPVVNASPGVDEPFAKKFAQSSRRLAQSI